jgi:flavin reductase (DIM6/NTAB) family NADH-FMN oxidoreductase RutF
MFKRIPSLQATFRMQFDLDSMAAIDRYELLLRTVVPRPIALVTTMSNDGMVNATPYSLFNVVGHDPAVAIRCTQVVQTPTCPAIASASSTSKARPYPESVSPG